MSKVENVTYDVMAVSTATGLPARVLNLLAEGDVEEAITRLTTEREASSGVFNVQVVEVTARLLLAGTSESVLEHWRQARDPYRKEHRRYTADLRRRAEEQLRAPDPVEGAFIRVRDAELAAWAEDEHRRTSDYPDAAGSGRFAPSTEGVPAEEAGDEDEDGGCGAEDCPDCQLTQLVRLLVNAAIHLAENRLQQEQREAQDQGERGVTGAMAQLQRDRLAATLEVERAGLELLELRQRAMAEHEGGSVPPSEKCH